MALDWKWLFLYPAQGVGAVNQLVIPAGVPVHFKLTSASVMNTFFVPQLGSMVYVVNGMQTELHLQADREGSYFGQSAQFSGDGFSDMNFRANAVSSDAFTRWAASLLGGGELNASAYRDLARQSKNVPPASFGRVQPGLFEAVVHQALPPGPGPSESAASGEPQVSPKEIPAVAAPPMAHRPQAEGAE
ncbi:cytochrome ubiquinol oxidase subunit II [Mesorhizobium sp. ORM8.1]